MYFLQVTRQLFEPLVMQLIHWFTNNKKFESQDTVAVLEAILVIADIQKRSKNLVLISYDCLYPSALNAQLLLVRIHCGL